MAGHETTLPITLDQMILPRFWSSCAISAPGSGRFSS
jgi:hypothetical protein